MLNSEVVNLLKKNKYEDIEMLDLEDKVDDILDIYINRLYHTEKTVGIVVNKEIAEYILDELVKIDETSIKEVDLVDYMEVDEYLVSVDDDGYITCVPIEEYVVLDKTDIVYIDMDGDILQDIIDYCVNEDKEVILFGQDDDEDCGIDCCDCFGNGVCEKTKNDATYKVNGKEVDKDEYEKAIEDIEEKYLDGIRDMLLRYCEIQDEMNEWRKLFRW